MRIALFDYGAGNLHSLAKALTAALAEVVVETDARRLAEADAVVLPGVGAFDAAAARLAPGRERLADALGDGLPCLGICLGMQLLFDGSDEAAPRSEDAAGDEAMARGGGRGAIFSSGGGPRATMRASATPAGPAAPATPSGLGLIPGRVTRLRARRVPQIGWNAVIPDDEGARDPLLAESGLEVAYYANSFACRPTTDAIVRAWSDHEGDRFPAMVRSARTVGVQFHPEKSSAPGVRFVRAWVDEMRRGVP